MCDNEPINKHGLENLTEWKAPAILGRRFPGNHREDRRRLPLGCLPDGQFPSGTAPTEVAAKAATEKPHDAYVLRQWAKGRLYREGTFRCPLKDWPEE